MEPFSTSTIYFLVVCVCNASIHMNALAFTTSPTLFCSFYAWTFHPLPDIPSLPSLPSLGEYDLLLSLQVHQWSLNCWPPQQRAFNARGSSFIEAAGMASREGRLWRTSVACDIVWRVKASYLALSLAYFRSSLLFYCTLALHVYCYEPAGSSFVVCLLARWTTLRRPAEKFSIDLAHDGHPVSAAHDLLLVGHLRLICQTLTRCKGYDSVRLR